MRRRLGLGLAALALAPLIVAGCDEAGIDLDTGPSDTGPGDTLVIVPEDGAPSPSPDGAGGPEPADPTAPPGPSGGDGGGDAAGGGPAPSRLNVNDRAGVGAMGPALLLAAVPGVMVEIDATPGDGLTNQSRNQLREHVRDYGQKASVEFGQSSTVPAQEVYSTADLRALMEAHRSVWSTAERASIYVMVLSGRHENEGVVAIAFNASAFAIFSDHLARGLLGLSYANFEEAAVIHELGHLYGLVNLTGHGAFHEDPEHPGHSASRDSVMYWAVESSLVEDVFTGGPPRTFDDADRQEMEAIRAAA